MNYRHIYHAGNFADVFKHVVLIILLKILLQKDKVFCYVDTHAGIGLYDLASDEAQKTQEYLSGLAKILTKGRACNNQYINTYLDIILRLNKCKQAHNFVLDNIQYYPGSPLIARALLRPQDRMLLTELHPIDVQSLKQEFAQDKQVAVHQLDAYLALKAFLPPKENRGLVLLDPSFELENEFELLAKNLDNALQRWRNGIYAIWYPLKYVAQVTKFTSLVKQLQSQYKIETVINTRLQIAAINQDRLAGCGLTIINPPWGFAEELAQTEKILQEILI